jgi:hypothetical protein
VPITKSLIDNSQGVFLVEDKKFLINNSVPLDIFTFSGKKTKLFYKQMRTHDKEGRLLLTEYIEEFSVWFLNYSDGMMSVTNKLYVY